MLLRSWNFLLETLMEVPRSRQFSAESNCRSAQL
jgi:hypothetical protein